MMYFRVMELNGVEISTDMLWAMGIIWLVGLAVRFFFCRSIRNTLRLIAAENRFLRPNQAWIAMIPIVNIYWNFVLALRMSNSFNNEFFDRKIAEEDRPALNAGFNYALFVVLANLPFGSGFVTVTGSLAIFFFIRYWLKIEQYRTLLTEHNRFIHQDPTA